MKVINTKDMDFEQKVHLLGKCFDILAVKRIRMLITPFEKQLKLRALCLNNLSILYKQNKQLDDALKAVDAAIRIEEFLL